VDGCGTDYLQYEVGGMGKGLAYCIRTSSKITNAPSQMGSVRREDKMIKGRTHADTQTHTPVCRISITTTLVVKVRDAAV
jgi:hypothetical protein